MGHHRVFALYVAGFILLATLLGAAEATLGLPARVVGWTFMLLPLAAYALAGLAARTSDIAQYYAAGRGVPPLFEGMAASADWMSAASFISLAGVLAVQGFSGLAYVMGWTGGYLLLAVLLAPYLHRFGKFTVPEFLGARYGGRAPRLIGILATVLVSFAYLVAQVTGVGLVVSRVVGLRLEVAILAGLAAVLACAAIGGLRSAIRTHLMQYAILAVAYLVPVVVLSWRMFSVPVPQLTYGRVLQENSARVVALASDPGEVATRRSWADESRALAERLRDPALPASDRAGLDAARATADAQARSPAAPGAAAEGQLQPPAGPGMWNFLALTFCLMAGTAGLPHILTRYHTATSVRQVRTSIAWTLVFILVLYLTAPAYAAFARHALLTRLVGARMSELPAWVDLWRPAGLFQVVDKLGDGVVQLADIVVRSSDFVVLAAPEMAGLPFAVTGLVLAGGMAAALSTADRLLLTIATTVSDDLYRGAIEPRAPLERRLAVAKIALVATALLAGWAATARLAIIVEMVAWAFSLAAATFFPVLVLGIWWKRASRAGAIAGMLAGLGITLFYLVASRFFGISWLGIAPVASGVFGIPLGFVAVAIGSLLGEAPPREMQDLVASVRTPWAPGSSAGAADDR